IFPCGFMSGGRRVSSEERSAARKRHGIDPEERLIFAYFGQQEHRFREAALEALASIAAENDCRVLWKLTFSRPEEMPPHPWLVWAGWVDDFDAVMAAGDVIVMHNAHQTIP